MSKIIKTNRKTMLQEMTELLSTVPLLTANDLAVIFETSKGYIAQVFSKYGFNKSDKFFKVRLPYDGGESYHYVEKHLVNKVSSSHQVHYAMVARVFAYIYGFFRNHPTYRTYYFEFETKHAREERKSDILFKIHNDNKKLSLLIEVETGIRNPAKLLTKYAEISALHNEVKRTGLDTEVITLVFQGALGNTDQKLLIEEVLTRYAATGKGLAEGVFFHPLDLEEVPINESWIAADIENKKLYDEKFDKILSLYLT